MAFAIGPWLRLFQENLLQSFPGRVLFLGLQGSYQRGEATEQSDIDLVVILEELFPEDLSQYRALIHSMPNSEKACGFLCGKEELSAWPKYDLFQLYYDTKPLVGSLDTLIPVPTKGDAEQALQIGAANLYHAACHTYLYSQNWAESLPALYKAAFFVLQAAVFIRVGKYPACKKELLPLLNEKERDILLAGIRHDLFSHHTEQELESAYMRLITWCKSQFRSIK